MMRQNKNNQRNVCKQGGISGEVCQEKIISKVSMFYTKLFTSKRGPLAKIWLAAHWEKKITKAHVFECNLENTIKELISPQIKIGLRTSGHLLLGVVRIYSRKAKYLLADCNDAVIKIKVAFRPGQTDLPSENLEATFKVITLPEDFADFSSQLPDINAIEVADHFSLNQCRTEDITLKEDLGNSFLLLQSDFGEESHQQGGLFDVSFPSLAAPGDGFGDEELGVDFLDFMAHSTEDVMPINFSPDHAEREMPETPPPTAVSLAHPDTPSPTLRPQSKASSPDQTTLLANEEEGFALEPVSETLSSDRKRVKRKRTLLVDRVKELSNEEIRDQLTDTSDLLCPMDMAPPTRKLMEWKEMGSVHKLFHSYCVPAMHPHLRQLFPRDLLPERLGADQDADGGGPEQMRSRQRQTAEGSSLGFEFGGDSSLLQESQDRSSTGHSLHGTPLRTTASSRHSAPAPAREHQAELKEVSLPDLSFEDSMRVHPPELEREPPQTQTQTQSVLASQDFEEKRMSSRAQGLLHFLRSQSCSGGAAVFSLLELNRECSRMQASATFFSFLLLKKQKALELHQDLPYDDIVASPGPTFHQL
ncbi:double-strand-break repair protein rad21-like protein 1 isoform X2 [Anguilla rostrata]|uniref:double-strand-break repair protein rad21-like protein 1 isoform X2 n=1 Tax=Anguilla rostrata TaxID=7938 RepID=UPI0030D28C60